MRHLVICGACVSPSPSVTLFEQLRKTSRRTRTDIPHMFSNFCDSVSSNCLHPLSCLAHICHPVPPPPPSPPLPSLCLPSSDLADNLAMDDFTFQEQLLTPRLATAGAGGAPFSAAPQRSSYLVPAVPLMLALLLLLSQWPSTLTLSFRNRFGHIFQAEMLKFSLVLVLKITGQTC